MTYENLRREITKLAEQLPERARVFFEDGSSEALPVGMNPAAWLNERMGEIAAKPEAAERYRHTAVENLLKELRAGGAVAHDDSVESVESRAVASLRRVKPLVEASGDRRAIDSYNAAITALKARMHGGSRVLAADAGFRRGESDEQAAANFQLAASAFHRRGVSEGRAALATAKADYRQRAEDCTRQHAGLVPRRETAEDFLASVDRARERMLNGQK